MNAFIGIYINWRKLMSKVKANTIFSCGKVSNTRKILRNDATEASMNWLALIEEYGVNYEWDGTTLLGEAIKVGRVDLVEALIKDKVDVNRPALYNSSWGFTIGILPLALAGATSGADQYLIGTNISPVESSMISVMLIKAGANVRTNQFDILISSLRSLDETAFNAALPKYDSNMLDFSFYGEKENKSGLTPFSAVHFDMQFEMQKPMLENLMKRNVQFGFYDIQKAIVMFLDPNKDTYGDAFLYEVLNYMANQRNLNFLKEEPSSFNENNLRYINPLDIAIDSIYQVSLGYDKISTLPNLYFDMIELFGEKGLRATPYEWSISEYNSFGTLPLFLRIIATKIAQEIKHRNPDNYSFYKSEELNAEVLIEWSPTEIIKAFEILSKYGALYHSLENSSYSGPISTLIGLNDNYPPDYLYKQVLRSGRGYFPYNDLVEPYYPVFEWLKNNGYLSYGVKEYLVYENGLSIDDFFPRYEFLVEERSITPNDRYAQYGIRMSSIEAIAGSNFNFRNYVLPQAREIIVGTRIGFTRNVRDIIRRESYSPNLLY
jgi:hypothetical protein